MPRRKVWVVGAVCLVALSANAQTTTTGAIQGTVTDEATGAPMLLVTVVASSPNLQGQASELTDATGQYYLSNLPPGSYGVVFLYGDAKVRRDNVDVSVGKVTAVNARINPQAAEIVTIRERAPAIDIASAKQGATLAQDYLKNVPNRGRTYDGILGAAGGAQGDRYGTSFSGSSSIENSYIVDGINTTGIKLGDVQSPVLNNFIQEIEVITGGYNAEFGRSTGGVVNVVTKSGSNDFHGSVWANVTPFEAARDPVQSAASAFRHDKELDTDLDFGFDVGGPIIKDRLWFYVGFAPFIQRTRNTRVAGTQIDRRVARVDYEDPACPKNDDGTCDGDRNPLTTASPGCELRGNCESDGQADLDDANNPIFEEIDRDRFVSSATSYQLTGKLNFALSPDHQGQVSFVGAPGVFHRSRPSVNAAPGLPCVEGTPTYCQREVTQLTADAAFKWTSKLNNNKTQIDALFGWHRWTQRVAGHTKDLPNEPGSRTVEQPAVRITTGDINGTDIGIARNWDTNESDAVAQFCRDEAPGAATVDQFPRIRNCPYNEYWLGGVGNIDWELEKRLSGKLVLTQRVKLLGHHQLKVGGDVEVNEISDLRQYSGGRYYDFYDIGIRSWISTEYARRDDDGPDVCGFRADGSPIRCSLLREGLPVDAQTFNWAAFVQDSWSILPNLTINAGLRYEEQRIGYADQVQSNIDPLTGQPVGDTALKLSGLFAPRIGVIYDPTKEGRSKIYANWGRFYESVPMDMNERAFGGESFLLQFWDPSQCRPFGAGANAPTLPSDPRTCPRSAGMDGSNRPLGYARLGFGGPAAGVPVGLSALTVPGIKAQSLDEVVVGVEYELLEDLRVGLSYQNRRLNTVVEDVSTDGGTTYYLANPGTFPRSEDESLMARIMQQPDGELRDILIKRLQDFRLIRNFDKPVRDYNAVQLTVAKRFSRNFMLQGSYTWSRLRGNYPGLFQPESGQLDPNITSQYDLPELLANRFGRLPGDRPHQIKLDGYYTFDLEKAGRLTTGVRVRAASGVPIEAIAAHVIYGDTESWLLPRGTSGRTPFGAAADLHVAYSRRIGDVDVELYCELFNVLNSQFETAVDNQYTYDSAHPIIGGDASDLAWAKTITGAPVTKNLNWRNTTRRQAPLSGRLGLTVAF